MLSFFAKILQVNDFFYLILDYIFGYTIGNDISQRDWQNADRTMFRGKNCDTFKPLGPWIVTGLSPDKFHITVRHNGEVWENFHSKDQIWDTATWVEELSRYTTLHVGDVLWMGTQGADGNMFPGDVIEVEISDIGVLKNYLVEWHFFQLIHMLHILLLN